MNNDLLYIIKIYLVVIYVNSGIKFDILFGPAYKGISLAAAVSISLSRDYNINVGFAYNRKEAKVIFFYLLYICLILISLC